jgi:uncharacterized membrane protein
MRFKRGVIKRALLAAAVTGFLGMASEAFGVTYVVTPLTGGLNGTARDISQTGLVCGVDLGHAFVWRPTSPNAVTGTLSMLPTLIPNFSSDAYGVSSSGVVVGHTGDDPLSQHEVPVAWLPDGSIKKLQLFNGVTSGGLASGINEDGRITGRNGLFTFDAGSVRWNTDGSGTYLGSPPGYANSYGWKINAGGAIVGTGSASDGTSSAFVHANGLFTFIPLLPGATLAAPYDINDVGHVVGSASGSGPTAFFYDGVSVQGLANVPGDLIQVSTAQGINNRDQIVGYAHPTANITGAVIWEAPGASPQYLNRLIDPSSPGYVSGSNPGWFVTDAVAINDYGQIAARGVSTSGGSYKALLLTPAHSVTGVDGTASVGLTLKLAPNPARGEVGVWFTMPRVGPARLQVADIGGRVVATVYDGLAGPGTTSARWGGRAVEGNPLPPGVYFLRLHTPMGVVARRLVLVR